MKRALWLLLLMAFPAQAWAACSAVPFTFSPNTTIASGQFNSNFSAVVGCVNAIDAGQITSGVLPAARGGTGTSVHGLFQTSRPADPVGTGSATPVMMGLAISFTPATSGRIFIQVNGLATNLTNSSVTTVGMKYGTGSAPGNGNASTGTSIGNTLSVTEPAVGAVINIPFGMNGTVSLSAGVTYWFDLNLASSNPAGGSISSLTISFIEQTV